MVPADGFLPALAEFCREVGAVFVADEIQTGFARTGKGHVMNETERLRVLPNPAGRGLFIAGEWREASGGATFGVVDPATGEELCRVADATPEDGPTPAAWLARSD